MEPSFENAARRFSARIAQTHTVGPRLAIVDNLPRGNSIRSESWLDLPVQCERTSGMAMHWLRISEARGDSHCTFTGDRDDLDDLYSTLKRLRVHEQFTLRPVPFDPSDAKR